MKTEWDWLDSTTVTSSGVLAKWVPYEDQYQTIFNDAVENNKTNVSFAINGSKYELDFQRMCQKNLKSKFERQIRMRILDNDEEDDEEDKKSDIEWCYWEWMNDSKRWIMYPPEINLELETHHREYLNDRTKSSFKIEIGETRVAYIVDFVKMAQVNSKSGFTRNVRRTVGTDMTNNTTDIADGGPSLNLRKRKAGVSGGASVVSTTTTTTKIEVDSKVDVMPPTKKLSKSSSSASSASNKEKRKKKDEEEDDDEACETDVKVEPDTSSAKSTGGRKKVKKEKEDAEADDENKPVETKATKSRGRKPAKKEPSDDEEETEEVKVEETDVKVVAFSGQAPVDETFRETVGDGYHVYKEGDIIYDCMLNQTNLQHNNNKYYLIQLLEDNKTKKFTVWMRWGRVGKRGQFSVDHCAGDLNKAKSIFERKFYDKTHNQWSDKDTFEKVPGKYDLVVKDYESDAKDFNDELDAAVKKTQSEKSKQPVPESKLDKSVQNLIELICNVKEMENMLKEFKYDAKKAPLGKLGKSQIKAGYAALKEIESLIKANDFGPAFVQANNDFYTRIPHDFGMRKPPTISKMSEVREKVKLLELLDDIEVAVKALAQHSDTHNPVDRHYEQLQCELKPIDKSSDTFRLICDYVAKTHAATHDQYKLKVLDVFEAERAGERERFVDHGNRMLLWHGSRITNWAGILSQGLRIAPEEAPVTGYMFGKGVYFSDCCSKSANYCYTNEAKNIGILSLSEVSLGATNNLKQADYNANKLPSGKMSTKGVGRSEPNPAEFVKLEDGLVVPCGRLKNAFSTPQELNSCSLLYNEFIVYNENQIKLRYIVKVEFEYQD